MSQWGGEGATHQAGTIVHLPKDAFVQECLDRADEEMAGHVRD
jgi:hypothetical protein